MKRRAVVSLLLVGVLGGVVAVASQEPLSVTSQQKRQYAVAIMRMINTAQVTHYRNAGRFASDMSEFTESEIDPGRLAASNRYFPKFNRSGGADAVQGFKLRMTVGQDGRTYTIKLTDTERGSCGTDAFSDDAGVIYLAGPIDCNFSALQPYNTAIQPASTPYTAVMPAPQAQPDVPPSTVRVSAGVAEGNLENRFDPVYPPLAQQARIQGDVILQAVIAPDGSVADTKVISGHPVLAQSAIDAVRQWRYKPYLLNGQPVAVMTQITVPFRLQ